jgi:DNA-binding response OmpR family regulator
MATILGKLLLVTDDADAGKVWANVLDRHGLATTVAGPRSDLMQEWEESGFDLAIVDVRDRINVPELCRGLRAGAVNPILLLAHECDESFCVEAYRSGADECIQKPVSPAVLVAKVRAWLRHSWTVRTESLGPLGGAVGGM